MARDRVDALDERVRRLLATSDHLREEHAAVRKRIRSLEGTVADTSGGCVAPTRAWADSDCHTTNISPPLGGQITLEPQSVDEASDEEVAAAISAGRRSRRDG